MTGIVTCEYQPLKYNEHFVGSVCQFGQDVGKLISIALLVEIVLAIVYVKTYQRNNLKKLILSCIGINIFIMVCMAFMNSSFTHKYQGHGWKTGLLEKSIPYFIAQFTGLALLYSNSL